MTAHHQSQPHSTFVVPPRFLGLSQRPTFHSFPLKMHQKPGAICRNYILWGSCRDWHCSRAHVPHGAMLDLFAYILEQDDCPLELRSLRGRFVRPVPGMSRRVHPSDQICSQFLERDGFCERYNRCPFAHLRRMQVYNSLSPSAKPIATSMVSLVSEADENLVVKLPEKANYTTQQPSLDDNIPPLSLIDQPNSTESDVPEPPQGSVLEPLSELIVRVRLPKPGEPQPANTAGSSVTERQEDDPSTLGHSPDVSEESSTESSLGLHSADNESTATDGCGVEQQDKSTICHSQDVSEEGPSERALDANSSTSESAVADGYRSSTPATTSAPSKHLKQRVCRWKRGSCRYRNCRYQHASPVRSTQTHGDNIAVQQAPPAQAPHDPMIAQTNTSPTSSSLGPMSHCTEVTGSTTIVERDPDIVVTESSLDFRSVENESTVTDGCGVEQQDQSTICHSQDISEEGSSQRTLDANSTITESAVADGRRSSTPTTSSPLSNPLKGTICIDWQRRRCRYGRRCKYLHIRSTQTQRDNTQAPPAQAPQDPPATQTNTVPVSSSPRPMPHCTEVAASTTIVWHDPAVIAASVGNVASFPVTTIPPHSHQNDPSRIPDIHADTHPSRPRIPRKAEEHPPLPRYTPGDVISLSVMESTNVKFSDGFSIERIGTGFESLWFVIEDIPESVDRSEIERLAAPFGVVQDVRFRDEKQSDKSASRTASVQMSSYREVVRAVNSLDGQDALGQRISCQLSLGKRLSKRMLRDTYVRVSWPAPCKAGYAGYSTLEAAQKAVSNADGKTLRGYWITASMYQSIPIIDAYNVRFTGLPPSAGRDFLDKFGPSEDTMLERPNYPASDFGESAVRKTLASFGKITLWDMASPPYMDGYVRAWCHFESPDVAAAACELNRVRQRSLGMEKILVRRALSVLDHIPRSRFKLVEQDLRRLQEDVWKHARGAYLNILSQYEGEKIGLRLVAEDSKTLARLRVELKEISDGEILKEDDQQVWDDFFCREAGFHFMQELRGQNPDVLIFVHSFRKCIRLVGTVERRQPVTVAILAKLSSLRQHLVRPIPLDRQAMGVLRSPDFAAAQQRYGEETIRIDLQSHQILVRGPDSLYEEVQQIVQTVKSRHVTDGTGNCPVCLEPPMAPVSLRCGHKWCKSCFVAYLTAAAGTRSFPISCLGNQGRCTKLVPMNLAREVLPPADFDALALAAFHAHVQARPGEYHYCPTPDCPQAYPTGPRNAPLSCPSCLARICPSCHVEYHEGITCADREDGGDRLFQEWMRHHDVKKCPGCHAPIERAAGCNHMTCTRCHTHTCWVCLETFPQGQGIYDHMREFHGSIGL